MFGLSVLLAFVLDKLFAEPKHAHPLVLFGNVVSYLEQRFNPNHQPNEQLQHTDTGGEDSASEDKRAFERARFLGVLSAAIAIVPIVLFFMLIERYLNAYPIWQMLVSACVLYIAVGWQSLIRHAEAIAEPLKVGDIKQARYALSMIVSRDTSESDEEAIAKATTESVLENGADAIFSALFWFCILGMPGVVMYRLSNTLDAMWGYKTPRFLAFGWGAARLDDVLNFIPARLTALTYALLGHFSLAMSCWQKQGWNWKSPNAGPVMSAGAGALNVSLGGKAMYQGEWQDRLVLGPDANEQNAPTAMTIFKACQLVTRGVYLWVSCIFLFSMLGLSVW